MRVAIALAVVALVAALASPSRAEVAPKTETVNAEIGPQVTATSEGCPCSSYADGDCNCPEQYMKPIMVNKLSKVKDPCGGAMCDNSQYRVPQYAEGRLAGSLTVKPKVKQCDDDDNDCSSSSSFVQADETETQQRKLDADEVDGTNCKGNFCPQVVHKVVATTEPLPCECPKPPPCHERPCEEALPCNCGSGTREPEMVDKLSETSRARQQPRDSVRCKGATCAQNYLVPVYKNDGLSDFKGARVTLKPLQADTSAEKKDA